MFDTRAIIMGLAVVVSTAAIPLKASANTVQLNEILSSSGDRAEFSATWIASTSTEDFVLPAMAGTFDITLISVGLKNCVTGTNAKISYYAGRFELEQSITLTPAPYLPPGGTTGHIDFSGSIQPGIWVEPQHGFGLVVNGIPSSTTCSGEVDLWGTLVPKASPGH